MPRSARRDLAPTPPGLVARVVLIATALSLTSCPHQGEAVRLLVRAAIHNRPSKATRTVRKLVQETASNAVHLTGPQIAAPPYPEEQAGREQDPDPVAYVQAHRLAALNVDGAPTVGAPNLTQPGSQEFHLPDREPPPTAEPLVYSIGRETQIYAEPRFDAKRIGYMRFGSDLRRTTAEVSRASCSGGWFGVQPSGFVCANGRTATTDPSHPLVQARLERPDRMSPLPYAYTVARRGIPQLYSFVPSERQLPAKSFSKRLQSSFGHLQSSPLPDWWRRPREVFGYQRSRDTALLGDGLVGGGVALLGLHTDAGMLYGVTPDLELVNTFALEAVKPSTFAGKALSHDEGLPVAFAMNTTTWLYRGDPRATNPLPIRQLARREAVALATERVTAQGQEWRCTKDGLWLRTAGLRIVEARTEWPAWAQAGKAWVDVSINHQTLVAYEGTQVAYVTLVSTGVDGLLDPATTKSTKTGVFHIVSKHLTATMNGEDAEGAYEMREVPWVQYFSEGYALHGAYWHDGFGQPRSHGCINMSPRDARWLFHFTNPGLPQNWHGTIPSEPSATVFVHP